MSLKTTVRVKSVEESKSPEVVRPTKKQQLLLEFIAKFIEEHGYGPSYREIMVGCNYTSVATVAVHVNNLISRGHLRKNGRSARSLEFINQKDIGKAKLPTNEIKPTEEKWLVDKIDYAFQKAESEPSITPRQFEDLQTLVSSLKVLNMEGASVTFSVRLNGLKERIVQN